MNLLLLFIILNVVNVIIQTIKSLATVKCGKLAAAIINAMAYGLYTVVIVYTNADLPLWEKVVVVAGANLIGVFFVKYLEEKGQKEKLWKIEVSVLNKYTEEFYTLLNRASIPNSFIPDLGNYTLFNIYCSTKEQSESVKRICDTYGGKYFASESKTLY